MTKVDCVLKVSTIQVWPTQQKIYFSIYCHFRQLPFLFIYLLVHVKNWQIKNILSWYKWMEYQDHQQPAIALFHCLHSGCSSINYYDIMFSLFQSQQQYRMINLSELSKWKCLIPMKNFYFTLLQLGGMTAQPKVSYV